MCEGLQFEGVVPPAEVLKQLQNKFTERQEGTRKTHIILSSRMKDKICLHLLVLCLFIDDFSVDFLSLQRDLNISRTKYVQFILCLCDIIIVTIHLVKKRKNEL